jgi:hypothetical protein
MDYHVLQDDNPDTLQIAEGAGVAAAEKRLRCT